jgi:FlaG/FlaF family flagellin (archaellin)
MVAITVILSAIIATFVLDLGGSVSQNPSAGVTFDEGGSGAVDVQLVSLENADQVDISTSNGADVGTSTLSSVGSTSTVGGTTALSDGETITVTATLDGKTSVIQTYTYDA